MKKLIVLATSCALLGGCVPTNTGPTTQPALVTTLVEHELEIRSTAGLATSLAILGVKDEDRVATARYIYETADAIDNTADGNLDAVNALALDLLNKWDSKYKTTAGALINSLHARLEHEIQNASVMNTDKAKVTKQLIQAVAKGVKDATLAYTQGTPVATRGFTAPAKKGVIVVQPLQWPTITK
jgi:hypothetical protein